MTDILTVLYFLTGLSLLMLIYAYVEDYMAKRDTEKLLKSMLDFEEELNNFAIKNLAEKNKVQGIKRITKVEPKKVVTKKPKTTTDMIKVNGKTKVVKRDKKGHFVK